MGKSDSVIFPVYVDVLRSCVDVSKVRSVAFLGFVNENELTSKITGDTRHFYDLALNNWNINADWHLAQKYDLIVCTRVAYFAKNPAAFVKKCSEHLTDNGFALVDWGLGDHWRFSAYKVGWVRNGEHEHAYVANNTLNSCFWSDELEKDEAVLTFWRWVVTNPKFGYRENDNVSSVVCAEVPSVVNYKTVALKCVALWQDSPQLYIMTVFSKDIGEYATSATGNH